MIYPNDHRPAHVHVIGNGGEAVFNLHCRAGPPELRECVCLATQELRRIAARFQGELKALGDAWKAIHGNHRRRCEAG